jgi:hypothetical protein
MLIQGLLQTIFFFFFSILIFFFFLGVVAPWRGVALAQGLAGLTPGPALPALIPDKIQGFITRC